MTPRLMVLATLLLGAAQAKAQYVATETLGVPYPALTNGTPVSLSAVAGDPKDRGRATLPLGFTASFYGRSYTQITVSANGMAFLEPSSQVNQTTDFSSNLSMPNTAEPNATLAPFWDDLFGRNAASVVRSQAVSGVNGSGLAIEWSDWNAFGTSTYSLTFQLRLWQNGIVEFYYGDMVGSGSTLTATVGIENGQGTVGLNGKGCSPTCKVADIATNSLIRFGPPPGPDLSVSSLQVNSMTPSGGNLVVSTTIGLRNFGSQAANGFTYRLYLSENTLYEPGLDTPVGGAQGPLSVASLGTTSHTASNTVARPAAGASVYVLAVVDDANVIAESNETNNLAATSVPYSTGVDLVAQDVSGPALGGPNETIPVVVTFSNQGIDVAGNVSVKVHLSTDATLDGSDLQIYAGTISVAGGQNVTQTVSAKIPAGIPANDYLYILQLDDGPAVGAIAESSETNNQRVGAQRITAKQADLVADQVTALEAVPPFAPASYLFIGEQIRLEAIVSNSGGATASPVTVSFYLSDNQTLNAITDTFVGSVQNLTVAPGQTITVSTTKTVPSVNANGGTLTPGYYYVFALATGLNVVEVSGQNNFVKSTPQAVKLPAPDLVPVSISGPQAAGAGEAFPVVRSIRNLGNRPATAYPVRYFLSANTIITEDDVPLKIRLPNGTLADARTTASLAVGGIDLQSDVVEVPTGTVPGAYYLGVLVDPPGVGGRGVILEVDESNNGFGGAQVTVIGQSLALDSVQLPDAILGLPYEAQLTAKGGQSAGLEFSLATGQQAPPGLTLGTDGRLTGTPTSNGAHGFTVVVSKGSASAQRPFVVRVVPPTASIAFVSSVLPPVVRQQPYEVRVPVVGGLAPYGFFLEEGSLPAGLTFGLNGAFAGSTTAPVNTTYPLTIRVRDSVGNTAVQKMSLVINDSSAVLITTTDIPEAKVGSQYVADVSLQAAGGAVAVARPVTWRVLAGRLPPGLALEPTTDDRLLISGSPTTPGVYDVTLEAVDGLGRADTADYAVRVVSQAYLIAAAVPEELLPGQAVDFGFGVLPMANGAVWSLRDGRLPTGISLGSDGRVTGTAPDEIGGRYAFTVQVSTGGEPLALRTYEIRVVEKLTPPPFRACGCGSAPAGLGVVALLLAARRRRARG